MLPTRPLPEIVRLGHKDIPVQYLTGGDVADLFGDSQEHPSSIRINSAYPQGVQAQTLLHEILHHVGWLLGLDWDEPVVRGLESLLLGLLRDQPEIWGALLESVREAPRGTQGGPEGLVSI